MVLFLLCPSHVHQQLQAISNGPATTIHTNDTVHIDRQASIPPWLNGAQRAPLASLRPSASIVGYSYTPLVRSLLASPPHPPVSEGLYLNPSHMMEIAFCIIVASCFAFAFRDVRLIFTRPPWRIEFESGEVESGEDSAESRNSTWRLSNGT